jgi:oxalate decarboxylase/phosphoglucose isomerase-like protein (cupin superfamily)
MKTLRALALLIATVALSAQTPNEVEITNEGHHHQVLQNDFVRVFKVEVGPHDATLMHRHRHDYMFISLGPADVSNEVEGKAAVALKLQDGQTGFLAGNFAHIARNLAPTPFRNVTIELMQDEKARTAPPPKWDEERGLQVLHGGTQEILFAKDGARVSEIELQPGGMIPSHHHNGPHLVVAITDLDMRSDIEGRGPTPSQLKSGEVKWVPGGYTHTLTNISKQPAKFVTVEFP